MNTKTLAIVGAVTAGVMYIGYTVWSLMRASQGCDPSVRACPLTQEQLARHLGEWCNPATVAVFGPIRESIRIDMDRIVKITRAGSRPAEFQRLRFFNESGRIAYRAYHIQTDQPVAGAVVVRTTPEGLRVADFANGQITWMRCEQMPQRGISEQVIALYRMPEPPPIPQPLNPGDSPQRR